MNKLDQKYIDVLESLGWNILGYTGEKVNIGKNLPFGIQFAMLVNVEAFPQEVFYRADGFDVEEQAAQWHTSSHMGLLGDGPLSFEAAELVADEIQRLMFELAYALADVEMGIL